MGPDVPDDFVFSLKASRYATNRKVLGEGGDSVSRFLDSGISELDDHLGPILWQFMATKKFEPEDFEDFLKLLPEKQDGIVLRHVVEVRHPSFIVPEFAALLEKYAVGLVVADHADYPLMADVTADFVYLRLQTGSDDVATCYDAARMTTWQKRIETWAAGGTVGDLTLAAPGRLAEPGRAKKKQPRVVYSYFITEGKVNAPAGAKYLQHHLNR